MRGYCEYGFVILLTLSVCSFLLISLSVDSPLARTTRLFFTTRPPTTAPPPTTTDTPAPTTAPPNTTTVPTTTPVPALVITCPADEVRPLGGSLDPVPGATAVGGCTTPVVLSSLAFVQNTSLVRVVQSINQADTTYGTVSNPLHTIALGADGTIHQWYSFNLSSTGLVTTIPNTNISGMAAAWDPHLSQWALVVTTYDTTLVYMYTLHPTSLSILLNVTYNHTSLPLLPAITSFSQHYALSFYSAALCAVNKTSLSFFCQTPYDIPSLSGFGLQRWTPVDGRNMPLAVESGGSGFPGVLFIRHLDDELHLGAMLTPTVDYLQVEHWTFVPSFNPLRYRIAVADFNSTLQTIPTPDTATLDGKTYLLAGGVYSDAHQSITVALTTTGPSVRWIELRWTGPPRWLLWSQGTIPNAFDAGIAQENVVGNTLVVFSNSSLLQYPAAYAARHLDNEQPYTPVDLVLRAPLPGALDFAAPSTSLGPDWIASSGSLAGFAAPYLSIVSRIQFGNNATYLRTWTAHDFCATIVSCNQTIIGQLS